MSNTYLENFDILSVYLENDYQSIFVCKHKKTSDVYLVNSIIDKTLVSDVDFQSLKFNVKAIIDIIETEEEINIIMEHKTGSTLIDYIKSNKMTLSDQVNFTSFIMDKIIKLKDQPNKIIESFLNHENLNVDDYGNISSTGVLLVNPNRLNISMEEVLRSIANVVSIIFSGSEISNNKSKEKLPPDIYRLINNCLENKYLRIIDLVSDYKSTNLYKLINPEKQESRKIHKMRKKLFRKRIMYKLKSKVIIVLLLIIPIMVYAINMITDVINKDVNNIIVEESKNKDSKFSENNIDFSKENTKVTIEKNSQSEESVLSANTSAEDIFDFLNEDMNIENEKNIGTIDSNEFHRGTSSIRVNNQGSESQTFLIGYIDLNDDKFNFMKDRVLNISFWIKSSNNTETSILLKLEGGGKVLSYTSKKFEVVKDNWIMQTADINSKNVDYIKMYITINPKEEMWIDSIEVDILK